MLHALIVALSIFCIDTSQKNEDYHTQIVDFTLPNVVTGNDFSLSELNGSKAIVIIFTSNYCPYAKLYNDRIKSLVQRFSSKGIGFVLINPNDPVKSSADNANDMAKQMQQLGLKVPYLRDSEQKIADMFGAQKTPEVFVLTHTGNNQYKVMYEGAIDDNPQVASDVDHHFLQGVIEDILKGSHPQQTSVHPTGCMIKR